MQKRTVLWWFILSLLVCNTLVTVSMDIAIVSMVNFDENDTETKSNGTICPTFHFTEENPEDESNHVSDAEKFNWNNVERHMVLSSYYWFSFIFVLPGSIISQKYGSKKSVGTAQLISSLLSIAIPFSAAYGATVVAYVRSIQGIASYISFPAAAYTVIGNWIPAQDRGKIASAAMVGATMGLTIGYFCFGYIGEYVHWKYIFHLTGLLGLVWSAIWFLTIYDSPQQHPTISEEEKDYIERHLTLVDSDNEVSIPWKRMIFSVPIMVCILAANNLNVNFVLLTTYVPIYLRSFYGMNSNEIGVFNSILSAFAGIAALLEGFLCDYIVSKNIFSTTKTRKMFSIVACFSVIPLIVIAFIRCNIHAVLTSFFLSKLFSTFYMYGAFLGFIDMSPTFCGILDGISSTAIAGFTVAFTVGINYLTHLMEVQELWRNVFLFTAVYSISTTVLYTIFGTSEVQSWNYVNKRRQQQ